MREKYSEKVVFELCLGYRLYRLYIVFEFSYGSIYVDDIK